MEFLHINFSQVSTVAASAPLGKTTDSQEGKGPVPCAEQASEAGAA